MAMLRESGPGAEGRARTTDWGARAVPGSRTGSSVLAARSPGMVRGESREEHPRPVSSRIRYILLLAMVAGLVAGVAALRGGGRTALPAREITISARDGSFDGTNPTLELKAGDRVALTIANQESAIPHDFVIAGLNIRTSLIEPGASETVVFTLAGPGVYRYGCTLHPGLMDGQVVVKQ